MSGLGEEATSEGRLGRGSGGEDRLGEGGGEGQVQNFLQLLLVPPRLRTPCLSLRLRCTPIRFSDRPSTHPLTNPPSCPAPRLQTGASAMSSYGDREQQEGI
jgi:hypothetical protein